MNNKFLLSENKTHSKDYIIEYCENIIDKAININMDLYKENHENENIHYFEAKTIIETLRSDEPKYEFLKKLRNKTGVYIFLNEGKPVYIGKGGSKKTDDLKVRMKNECKHYGENKDESPTLSKNIQKIETGLTNTGLVNQYEELMKKFQIIAVVIGEMSSKDDQYFTDILEAILIAIFRPKYNK